MKFSLISTFFLGLGVGVALGGGFQPSVAICLLIGLFYAFPTLVGDE